MPHNSSRREKVRKNFLMEYHRVKSRMNKIIFALLFLCIANLASCAPHRHHRHRHRHRDHIQSFSETPQVEPKWWETNQEIQLLQEYLRIPTVHPDPDYGPCVEFLKRQAESLGLPCVVHYPSREDKPVVQITWKGTEPDLPSILLSSHMDVVPVYPESWEYPPFGATIDEEGRIFARGAEDMKSQGMAYLGAIRHLRDEGYEPKNTVHVTYVPDEEIGSVHGMKAFVQTQEFKDLNVGFAVDEGIVSFKEDYFWFYAEKTLWHIRMVAKGQPGHGALLVENTAGDRLSAIIAKMMEYRQGQIEKVNAGIPQGNVTSINLTKVSGGIQTNVIPESLTATFDIRMSPNDDPDEFIQRMNTMIEESGGSIDLIFDRKDDVIPPTILDSSDPYYTAFQEAMEDLGFTLDRQIIFGVSDARFLRSVGIKTIGFMPMNNTPMRYHDHNEFVFADQYIKAIEGYSRVIEKLTD